VLLFTFGCAVATGLLFSVAPALRVRRDTLVGTSTYGTRTVTGRGEQTRACLAGSQVALALVLLVCAALLTKSFMRLTATNAGFAPDHVTTLTVDLPESTYASVPRVLAFHDAMLARMAAAPGVAAVGLVNFLPLGGTFFDGSAIGDDHRKLPDDFGVDEPAVSSDYFRAMGIHVMRGRAFTAADDAGSLRVAIVSASAARTLWLDQDPIGRRLSLEDAPAERDWLTVVGVVDDVRQQQLAMPPDSAVYQPYAQVDRVGRLRHMSYVARAAGDAGGLAASFRAALRGVDPDLPADQVQTMTAVVNLTVAGPRFQTGLLTGFAVLALALALVGVYGVLAYSVAQRTREISIRLALGAQTSRVLAMILGRTALLASVGVAVGSVGAMFAARGLAHLDVLFDVSPRDPAIFAAVAGALVGAALLAGLIPAIRAQRVDPIVALRHE
jgi:putative ABC transport system permease protein